MCVAGLGRLLTDNDDKPIHDIGMEQLAVWVRTLATSIVLANYGRVSSLP